MSLDPSDLRSVPAEADGDLPWLAFRYVSDELSVEETVAFEERLLTDARACEAVARAVVLSQAVRSAESSAPAVPAREPAVATEVRRSRVPSIGVAVAAVIAIGVAAFAIGTPSPDGSSGLFPRSVARPAASEAGAFAGELIARWRAHGDPTADGSNAGIDVSAADWDAEDRDADDSDDAAHGLEGSLADAIAEADPDAELSPRRGGGTISVPGWMLAAVAAAHPGEPSPAPEPDGGPQ